MDKLTTCIIMCILFLCGPVVAALLLMICMLFNSVNVKTLLLLWLLCTNYLYTFVDIIYIIFSSGLLIVCGVVYWCDITYDDINKIDTRIHYITKLCTQYKNIYCKLLINKLNISNTHIELYHKYYNNMSLTCDKLYIYVYDFLCNMFTITRNIPLFKTIYQKYDNIVKIKKNNNNFTNKSFADFTNKSFADIINNMSPDEKTQISDMANSIFRNNDILSTNFDINNLLTDIRNHKKMKMKARRSGV